MTFGAADLAVAWLLDAVLGDPARLPWPHPVVVVGRMVRRLEGAWHGGPDATFPVLRGFALWVTVVGAAAGAAWAAWAAAWALHPVLGRLVGVYLAYACLATRDLSDEARAVARRLRQGRLDAARRRLGRIVGRDTGALPATAVARAAVETVAENASDGVLAPLFYLVVGGILGAGPALGVAYKAANTLDSMVGYRDERYERFGKASARLDDLLNWVPARLTAVGAVLGAQTLWRRGGPAARIALRDGRLTTSPNAGFPEAAWAGALGIVLGGPRTYRGSLHPAPRLGAPGREPGHRDVGRAVHLLWAVSVAAAAAGCLVLARAAG